VRTRPTRTRLPVQRYVDLSDSDSEEEDLIDTPSASQEDDDEEFQADDMSLEDDEYDDETSGEYDEDEDDDNQDIELESDSDGDGGTASDSQHTEEFIGEALALHTAEPTGDRDSPSFDELDDDSWGHVVEQLEDMIDDHIALAATAQPVLGRRQPSIELVTPAPEPEPASPPLPRHVEAALELSATNAIPIAPPEVKPSATTETTVTTETTETTENALTPAPTKLLIDLAAESSAEDSAHSDDSDTDVCQWGI